ncbi:hypothetical protein [Nocardia sp. NBC_01329]|uniref:hypothetical protein n=1 Tax=Nocardia sp. NBC_01329 TaxID=2903594 RepID=UPI002E166775|nr:hypothetical protein OG405_27030 [Nocardia sp. NBC_01329]
MTLPRSAAVAALVSGSLALGFGTAHAEPAPAPKETVNYAVQLLEKTVVATVNGGTFAIVEKEISEQEPSAPREEPVAGAAGDPIADDGKGDVEKFVEIKDKAGNPVVSWPLAFNIAGTEIPVKSEVKKDGAVLEITPEKPAGLDTSQPVVVKPIASLTENQQAQNEFASNFGIATAIGGFVGTAVGAVIGCVVTIVAGCVPGLLTGAGVGGILGTIAVGGPTLVAAGIELINTIQAPAGSTKWANDGQGPAPASAEAPVEAPAEPPK